MNQLIKNNLKIKRGLSERVLIMRESIMTYLPMVMLSVLFLFSVWLVRSVNQIQNNSPIVQVTHIADYEFKKFKLKNYEINGKLKSSMQGEIAEHFLDTKNTEVSDPNVLIYTKDKITSAIAKRAVMNEDGSQLQLIGKTSMKRLNVNDEKKEIEISGDYLHFFSKTDKIESHMPVKIVRGDTVFRADRLMADNLNQIFELKGHVEASIAVR